MRPFEEWDEDYILNGIPPGEHDWVEFKGSQSLDFTLPNIDVNKVLDTLSKQLSAFANAGGGAIVYGVDANQAQRAVDGGGVPQLLKPNGTHEWLEDIIPNLVEFPLFGVNVYPIHANGPGSQIEAGKAIYVIHVPDSAQAPHQANDRVYYARLGGRSRPISHRMVMDIAGRQKHPEITIDCELGLESPYGSERSEPTLTIWYENAGRIFANYINGWVYVPEVICEGRYGDGEIMEGVRYVSEYFDNTIKETVGYRKGGHTISLMGRESWMPREEPLTLSRYQPLLPSLRRRAFRSEVKSGPEMENHRDLEIRWKIFADNADKKEGSITIGEILDDAIANGRFEESA